MTDTIALGAKGGAVTLLAQLLKLLIQFANLIVLSRLLSPDDFGLIAMVTAFVALGELIRDFGTGIVGLARRELNQQEASNLFWMSTLLGLIAAMLLVVGSPSIAKLYSDSRIIPIMPALAIGLLLNALSAQFGVKLAREMRHWRRFFVDAGAPFVGVLVAIVGALCGWGYWALIAQTLATAFAGFGLRVWFSQWKPSLPRKGKEGGSLAGDSISFGLAQLTQYIATNIDTILVGARWNAAVLGEYNRAFQLLKLPLNQMVSPITQVIIPTLNRLRTEGRTTDSVLLPVQFGIGLVVNLLYAISAGIAPWLLPLVLGEQWEIAIPIYQILALGGSVWVFNNVNYWVFIIENHGRQLLYYGLFTKSIASLLIFIGSLISIEAVAWAASMGTVIAWPICLFWLSRCAMQPAMAYFFNGCRLLLATGVSYYTTRTVMDLVLLSKFPSALVATCSAVLGTVVFFLAIVIMPKGFHDLRQTVLFCKKLCVKNPKFY